MPNRAYCPRGYASPPGALRFPWESGASGLELQYGAYKPGRIDSWGKFEQHISADIALAARQHFYATADRTWLKTVGFPLVRGVAAFYSARVTKRSAGGRLSIEHVMGPDEYAKDTNNSAFTNAAVALTLAAAAELATLVNESVPASWGEVAKKLRPRVAPVPHGSGASGDYHPEYDSYPHAWRGALVKQADAVLLQYPLEWPMDAAVRRNDLLWYDAHTDRDGPAMTWGVFAINWMRLGNWSRARELFRRSYADNVRKPFNVWTETVHGGCTPFLTGAGGFLQAIVHGAAGLHLQHDRLTITAAPPSVTSPNVTALSLRRFHWRGARLTITITEATVSVERLPSATQARAMILIAPDTSTHPLQIGGPPVVLPRHGELAVKEVATPSQATSVRV